MKKLLTYIVIILLAFSTSAFAATLYVRPVGGSYGSEDGSDYANAFDGEVDVEYSTTGNEAGKVGPGDTLYAVGGIFWDEFENFTGVPDGRPDELIILDGDDGVNPRGYIAGRKQITGAWADDGAGTACDTGGTSTLYYKDIGERPFRVWAGLTGLTYADVELVSTGSGGVADNDPDEGLWGWTGTTVYYCKPTGSGYTPGTDVFQYDDMSYHMGLGATGVDYWEFRDLYILRSGWHGMYLSQTCNNNIIRDSVFTYNGSDGAGTSDTYEQGAGGLDMGYDNLWEDVEVSYNIDLGFGVESKSVSGGKNATIRRMWSHHNQDGGANCRGYRHPSLAAAAFTADFTGGAYEDMFTLSTHNFVTNQRVRFVESGGLPTGISAATDYYVIKQTSDVFQVAASAGGAVVEFTSDGTGTNYSYTYNEVSCSYYNSIFEYNGTDSNYSDCGLIVSYAEWVIFERNIVRHNAGAGVKITESWENDSGSWARITNNLIHNNNTKDLDLFDSVGIFIDGDDADDSDAQYTTGEGGWGADNIVYIYNNTVWDNYIGGGSNEGHMETLSVHCDPQTNIIDADIKVSNNIFIGAEDWTIKFNCILDGDGGTTFDDNVALQDTSILSNTNRTKWTDYATTAWNALSYVGTDIYADPLLDSNYKLQLGSPAINAGTAWTGWAPYYDGTLPDIGRYQWGTFATEGLTVTSTLQ